MAPATVDTVLDKLSRCHVVIFVFAFLRGLPVTWNMMMPVFVSPSAVEFRCAEALNGTVATASGGGRQIWTNSTAQCFTLDGTNASKPCESWVYDRSVYGKTVTEEGLLLLFTYAALFGTLWPSLALGPENPNIIITIICNAAFGKWRLRPTFMHFFCRLSVMETVSPRFRYMPTMTLDNGWTTGMLLLPWLHYLTREWRATQLYAALPLAPLLVLGW
ncbi:hypothetical protein HPB49_001997 [Dermacentor silvarum]|uniref:Uncharacterized protein n=1 Tax=Dermacentor silvarum TaxID=543639 RepID=A0ACB8CCZ3_DERSI|nr:hypothetical protein HPB49_001997 [Dermacentor silvarum]